MAKVKIILDRDESIEEAKEDLIKALSSTNKLPKQFPDPVLEDVYQKMDKDFKEMYEEMFKEILEIMKLDDETLKLKKSLFLE